MGTFEYMCVFLVDDDELFLHSLKHFLSKKLKSRILIRAFSTGEECLSYLHQKPDLVLLDYQLDPEEGLALNGLEVLSKIRSLRPQLPVVILSANGSVQTAVEAVKHGAYDYIEKNEAVFDRTVRLLEDALKSLSFFGKAGNFHFWTRKKTEAHRQLCLCLQGRSRPFFAPFFLPDKVPKTPSWTLRKKKKARAKLVPG
jgi:DNA-binding NtrC family response regulator